MTAVRKHALEVWAVVVVLAMLLPLAVILACSTTSTGFVSFPPQGFSFRWYTEAFRTPAMLDAFEFTLVISLATAAISLLLGSAAAYGIARSRFRGRGALLAVLMAPFMVPQIVLAVGIVQVCSYADIGTSPQGLLAGHVAITLPFVVRLVLSGLDGVDPRLEAASMTLGASRLRTIWAVTLPGIRASLAAAGVFAFLLSFDETGISVFTALPGSTTLPALVYQYAEQQSTPLLTAVSSMLVIFGCVVAIVLEKVFGLLRLLTGTAPP
jgi:putative spermidine/putrescine transport system permease protein